MAAALQRNRPAPARPLLDLSGPRLRQAFESLVECADASGGVERYVGALALKASLFEEVLGKGRVHELSEAEFCDLAAFIAPARRRIGPWLGENGFPLLRQRLVKLLDGWSDVSTADRRMAAFVDGFPLDRGHRWVRDLAAEVLHYTAPERYPLMTRWMWDARVNTGVLREIWHGEDFERMTIPVADDFAAFAMLTEELEGFLAANGVYRDVPFTVDLLSAHIYAAYINDRGGQYLHGDYCGAQHDAMVHTRRMLGLDAVDSELRPHAAEADRRRGLRARPAAPAERLEDAAMPIHEKSLIRPENLVTHEHLSIDGVDVSGHWSTFIKSRVVTDYNEAMEDEIAALAGGEFIHRCWQCGSCTNACTVNALNPDFNPRYWIYLIRMGFEDELVRDKDLVWQCVSCNKCTYACPRDVNPEGVMKATAHWLELKGYNPPKPATVFDDVFSAQVFETGKIEDGRVLQQFFRRTGQSLFQDWLIALVRGLLFRLPVGMLTKLGLATLFRPKTRGWAKARAAIDDYVEERETADRRALGLEMHQAELGAE